MLMKRKHDFVWSEINWKETTMYVDKFWELVSLKAFLKFIHEKCSFILYSNAKRWLEVFDFVAQRTLKIQVYDSWNLAVPSMMQQEKKNLISFWSFFFFFLLHALGIKSSVYFLFLSMPVLSHWNFFYYWTGIIVHGVILYMMLITGLA